MMMLLSQELERLVHSLLQDWKIYLMMLLSRRLEQQLVHSLLQDWKICLMMLLSRRLEQQLVHSLQQVWKHYLVMSLIRPDLLALQLLVHLKSSNPKKKRLPKVQINWMRIGTFGIQFRTMHLVDFEVAYVVGIPA